MSSINYDIKAIKHCLEAAIESVNSINETLLKDNSLLVNIQADLLKCIKLNKELDESIRALKLNSEYKFNILECLNDDMLNELKRLNIAFQLEYYMKHIGVINIDENDLVLTLNRNRIVSYFSGFYHKNFSKLKVLLDITPKSGVLLIMGNQKLSLNKINEIIEDIKEQSNSQEVIFGMYFDEKLDDDKIEVLAIFTA